jgi:hypothetical protein
LKRKLPIRQSKTTVTIEVKENRPNQVNKRPISVKKEKPSNILRKMMSSNSHVSVNFSPLRRQNRDWNIWPGI